MSKIEMLKKSLSNTQIRFKAIFWFLVKTAILTVIPLVIGFLFVYVVIPIFMPTRPTMVFLPGDKLEFFQNSFFYLLIAVSLIINIPMQIKRIIPYSYFLNYNEKVVAGGFEICPRCGAEIEIDSDYYTRDVYSHSSTVGNVTTNYYDRHYYDYNIYRCTNPKCRLVSSDNTRGRLHYSDMPSKIKDIYELVCYDEAHNSPDFSESGNVVKDIPVLLVSFVLFLVFVIVASNITYSRTFIVPKKSQSMTMSEQEIEKEASSVIDSVPDLEEYELHLYRETSRFKNTINRRLPSVVIKSKGENGKPVYYFYLNRQFSKNCPINFDWNFDNTVPLGTIKQNAIICITEYDGREAIILRKTNEKIAFVYFESSNNYKEMKALLMSLTLEGGITGIDSQSKLLKGENENGGRLTGYKNKKGTKEKLYFTTVNKKEIKYDDMEYFDKLEHEEDESEWEDEQFNYSVYSEEGNWVFYNVSENTRKPISAHIITDKVKMPDLKLEKCEIEIKE